jgi:hypothetical protein
MDREVGRPQQEQGSDSDPPQQQAREQTALTKKPHLDDLQSDRFS